jgi:MbtH protein
MTEMTEREHLVVINDEEQYSVWPTDRELPLGWRSAGFAGSRDQCLEHIEEHWTDIRPLSLRRQLYGLR